MHQTLFSATTACIKKCEIFFGIIYACGVASKRTILIQKKKLIDIHLLIHGLIAMCVENTKIRKIQRKSLNFFCRLSCIHANETIRNLQKSNVIWFFRCAWFVYINSRKKSETFYLTYVHFFIKLLVLTIFHVLFNDYHCFKCIMSGLCHKQMKNNRKARESETKKSFHFTPVLHANDRLVHCKQ